MAYVENCLNIFIRRGRTDPTHFVKGLHTALLRGRCAIFYEVYLSKVPRLRGQFCLQSMLVCMQRVFLAETPCDLAPVGQFSTAWLEIVVAVLISLCNRC